MDYLYLDMEAKIQDQLKYIDAFNTLWQIIALSVLKNQYLTNILKKN
jgi:hypothetical protein